MHLILYGLAIWPILLTILHFTAQDSVVLEEHFLLLIPVVFNLRKINLEILNYNHLTFKIKLVFSLDCCHLV